VAIIVTGALLAVMIGALIFRPDKYLLDIALPAACFLAFAWWRDRR
jgi:hypothetical protein